MENRGRAAVDSLPSHTGDALALREARLAAVLESVSDVFHVVDASGRLTLVNAASERFYGFSREDVLGRPLLEVFPDLAGSAFEPMLRAAMNGEHPPPLEEACVVRPDRRVLARVEPITGGGVTITFTDVTDRWKAEMSHQASDRQAREQLEELEAIYESSPVGLASLTKDLQFVRVNRRLAEMNGVPAAEHVGRKVGDLLPAIADQMAAILTRLQSGEEVVSYEISGETPAAPGVQSTWLEYWTPLRDAGGDVRGLNVVVEEITERKRAEARTRLLIDELNHRVKNTLSVVQNLARQSLRGRDISQAEQAFEQRLLALAAAHNVLTERRWEAIGLREVATTAIGAAEPCVTLHGPDVAVGPDVAIALSLALHELTTNALKYGALSTGSGGVDLEWTQLPENRVRVRWREHGGPPVEAPIRHGFGTRLLGRAMDGLPDGKVVLEFPVTGVECEIFVRPMPIQPTWSGPS